MSYTIPFQPTSFHSVVAPSEEKIKRSNGAPYVAALLQV